MKRNDVKVRTYEYLIFEPYFSVFEMERQNQTKAPKVLQGRISFLQYNTFPTVRQLSVNIS